jgi:hypothetical protein
MLRALFTLVGRLGAGIGSLLGGLFKGVGGLVRRVP